MTTTNSIDQTTLAGLGLTSQASTGVKKSTELGQEDFLELMVAQMSHQDPLEPQANGEFIAQMAQFGTVDGIAKLQESFAALNNSLQSNQALQASALVGRTVMVPANQQALAAGGSITGEVELPTSGSNVTVAVFSEKGELVRQLNLGDHAAGTAGFTWDGKNQNGDDMPAGKYKFVAQSSGYNGQANSLTTNIAANVDSVSLGTNGAGLKLNVAGLGSVDFESVKEIK